MRYIVVTSDGIMAEFKRLLDAKRYARTLRRLEGKTCGVIRLKDKALVFMTR